LLSLKRRSKKEESWIRWLNGIELKFREWIMVIFIFVLLASCIPIQDQPAVPVAVESIRSELGQIRALDSTLNSIMKYLGADPPKSTKDQEEVLVLLDAYHIYYIRMETHLSVGDLMGFEEFRVAASDQLKKIMEMLFPHI